MPPERAPGALPQVRRGCPAPAGGCCIQGGGRPERISGRPERISGGFAEERPEHGAADRPAEEGAVHRVCEQAGAEDDETQRVQDDGGEVAAGTGEGPPGGLACVVQGTREISGETQGCWVREKIVGL